MLLRSWVLMFMSVVFIRGASASCGSATCPLNNTRYLGAGLLRMGYAYEYINQDRIYVGTSRSFIGAIPEHHDEVQTINQRNILSLDYGITGRMSLSVQIPFVHREHSHIHHHMGEDLWESWNFGGVGDVVAAGQYTLPIHSTDMTSYVTVLGGIKFPTGVTDMKNAEGELAEVTIQPGTGSYDGIVGVNARQSLGTVPTFSGLVGTMPVIVGITYQVSGLGTDGYRFGNALLAHVGTEYPLARAATFLFQINGKFQGYADVGSTGEPRENTGGTWIFASPGLSLMVTDVVSAYAFVQFPVYQNVHGIQQTSAVNMQFGISTNVDLLD